MKKISAIRTLFASALLVILTNLPAVAEIRVPKQDEAVQCVVNPFHGGAAYVVECMPRWSGMVLPDPVFNGYSGLLFCSYDAAPHYCPEPAITTIENHPEPLKPGIMTCTMDWGKKHLDQTRFDCVQ